MKIKRETTYDLWAIIRVINNATFLEQEMII